MSKKTKHLKYIPSEKMYWLRKNYPNAYLLLSLIAERARRVKGHLDGLDIGDAHIGDYQEAGISSEQQYRTAKAKLVEFKIIKIKETCRTRKKSTTGTTTEGTLVTLLNSEYWDINPGSTNDLSNDRATTEQRPSNDEQEGNKKEIRKNKEISEAALSLLEYFNISLSKIKGLRGKECEKKTAKDFDELLKTNSVDEIKKAIDYAHNSDFWKSIVLSPSKLREKFDTLNIQLNNPQNSAKAQEMPLEMKEKYKKFAQVNESKICDMNSDALGIWFIPHYGQNKQFQLKFTENGFADQLKKSCIHHQFKFNEI